MVFYKIKIRGKKNNVYNNLFKETIIYTLVTHSFSSAGRASVL